MPRVTEFSIGRRWKASSPERNNGIIEPINPKGA